MELGLIQEASLPVRVLVPTALLSDASRGPWGIRAAFPGLKASAGAPWPSRG